MRTPTRKPGKYNREKQDPHLSPAKYAELKDSLERLRSKSRLRAIAEVKTHAQDGDFSENAAYQIAKGRLRGINRRIDEIEDLLKRAVIIESNGRADTVRLGAQVYVEVAGKNKAYQILGPAEADPARGIISHLSPLGQALLGKKVGETAALRLKTGFTSYKIIKIL